VALPTPIRHLLLRQTRQRISRLRPEPIVKNPLEIVIPDLCWSLLAVISFQGVGLVSGVGSKTDRFDTPSDQPVLLQSNMVMEKPAADFPTNLFSQRETLAPFTRSRS
jgi:hypothetical protein